jgi:hypothetical protein
VHANLLNLRGEREVPSSPPPGLLNDAGGGCAAVNTPFVLVLANVPDDPNSESIRESILDTNEDLAARPLDIDDLVGGIPPDEVGYKVDHLKSGL